MFGGKQKNKLLVDEWRQVRETEDNAWPQARRPAAEAAEKRRLAAEERKADLEAEKFSLR